MNSRSHDLAAERLANRAELENDLPAKPEADADASYEQRREEIERELTQRGIAHSLELQRVMDRDWSGLQQDAIKILCDLSLAGVNLKQSLAFLKLYEACRK